MGKYQSYENYKDSGVEWLGEIPEHWEQKRFKFAVDLINNKVEAEDSDLPYMGLEHIESWTGKRIEDENASSEGIGSHFLPNDVLFGKLRPYLAKVYLSKIEGLASTEALVLRSRKDVSSSFLKYYILSRDFINIVDSSTFGAKMPRASWDFIGNLFFSIPPLEEQGAIAQFLDHKTSQIDALIAKKEALLEKLDEKRTALISHAVTKGLDPTVPMKDSGIEWLGDIPAHWDVIPIKFSLSMPITDGPHETPELFDEGIPFISAESIKNDSIDFDKKRGFISEEEHERFSRKYKPQYGDVYMVKSGATTGNVARVKTYQEFNIWSPLAALRPNREKTTTDFLFYVIKSKPFFYSVEQSWSFGTQQNIGMGVIANIRITFPPLEEQDAIAQFLDHKTAEIDQQKTEILKAIDLLKEYRTALITNAVTGKIDVRQVRP